MRPFFIAGHRFGTNDLADRINPDGSGMERSAGAGQFRFERSAISAADGDAGAVSENGRAFASKHWLELPNALDVDDSGTMNARESLGIEPTLHAGHRLANQVGRASNVQRT